MAKRKVGRAATSGQFISIEEANRRPATSVIETIEIPSRNRRRRSVRHSAADGGPETPSKTKAGSKG